jgi:hypothetical protein
MGACNSTTNKIKQEELARERQRLEKFRQDFERELIEEHNKLRELHNVPPLKKDPELTKHAQDYASKLAELGITRPSKRILGEKTLGENLCHTGGAAITAKKVIDMWYREVENYTNFANPEPANNNSKFTQLVWKDTECIGIGVATLGHSNYVVANYYPAGNIQGDFEKNVFPVNSE